MDARHREFLFHLRRVQQAYEYIFAYCGVKCPDFAEFDPAAWQQVLDCRHGDSQLEELFLRVAEEHALKQAAYDKMIAEINAAQSV